MRFPLLLVFYDETCGICQRLARLLSRWSDPSKIRYLEARQLEEFTNSPIVLQARYIDIHGLAEGQIFRGYATYLEIARRLRWGKGLFWLMQVGWIRALGERLYRHIADSRTCQHRPLP